MINKKAMTCKNDVIAYICACSLVHTHICSFHIVPTVTPSARSISNVTDTIYLSKYNEQNIRGAMLAS